MQGKESGAIEKEDYDIIKNAFEFSQHTTRQVMVPRTQVVAIDLNDFNDATIEKLIEESYSRIPCYEDNLDHVVGVVYLKDILLQIKKNEPVNIKKIMRPVLIIPETKRIGKLLKEFQSKHQQMAVVINEYGGTKGIITMEDILEELVGEIQDEFDNETSVVEKISEKNYSVIASTALEDINKLLPHPIKRYGQYDTLGGYLIHKFGRLPNTNDKISFDDYEFTILKKSKNTIMLVHMRDLS